jgi:hypothetical protein
MSFILIVILWGAVIGSYMRGVEGWHMLAFIALVLTWFVILDAVETAYAIRGMVDGYAKRNKKS